MIKFVYLGVVLVSACLSSSASGQTQTCRTQSEIPASTPTERFNDNGDGTTTDLGTGLMWARCAARLSGSDCTTGSVDSYTWQQALDLANANTLAGFSDWRLPNVKELGSIVERQCHEPSINLSVFPNTPASDFWSASPHAYNSSRAWYVKFSSGRSDGDHRDDDYRSVRLVRGP